MNPSLSSDSTVGNIFGLPRGAAAESPRREGKGMGLRTGGGCRLKSEVVQLNWDQEERTHRNSVSKYISTVSEVSRVSGNEYTQISPQQRGVFPPLILWRVMNLPGRGSASQEVEDKTLQCDTGRIRNQGQANAGSISISISANQIKAISQIIQSVVVVSQALYTSTLISGSLCS